MKENKYFIKVSIVVPIFNEAKYLKKSVKSLIHQYYSNIEIILVNDGSTDESLRIINSFQKSDDRIVIINKPNGGLVDATIAGIKAATGEYTCFLDPDDYVGPDFVSNYINLLSTYGKLDFYATGFYQDNNGIHFPYSLRENKLLNSSEIKKLQQTFLYDGENTISNSIFISRWNKMYKTSIMKALITTFSNYKNVNLGEDTIFSCIMLHLSTNGFSSSLINSYYYNTGNQDSMMNNSSIESHFNKTFNAYTSFKGLLNDYDLNSNQAYILYYDLIGSLSNRIQDNSSFFNDIFNRLKDDKIYMKAISILFEGTMSSKQKIKLLGYKYCPNYKTFNWIKKNTRSTKLFCKKIITFIRFIKKEGIRKGSHSFHFWKLRNNAHNDVIVALPTIEKRIVPFLKKFEGKKTNLSKTTIEKNIFIFWWDGLDNAPDIVKICVKSVQKNYPDYKVIIITKNNYKNYSNINEKIIHDFKLEKISIQTFSDILRFNLLYNNGGMWTDATIFYREKYNLVENLREKSFESISFNTSSNFLNYKDCSCSWSGYLIASRKNGLLAKVMNTIYEQYYLKYGNFPIYFFIDAALMICKIKHVDADVLNKVQKSDYNMFDLYKILNLEFYTKEFEDNTMIPQKLSWSIDIPSNPKTKTNYEYLKEKLK